jgi:LCP family protein required for cell wall assembly
MRSTTSPEGGSRRSAFAAAFLSFLFPGLGQAYAGRPARALLFGALPVVLIAFLAGVMSNERTSTGFLATFASPTALLALFAFNVVLLVYRGIAVVDAYRSTLGSEATPAAPSARRPVRRGSRLHPLSVLGLLAVLLVLGAGHVAAGQYILVPYNLISRITSDDPDEPTTPPAATATPAPTATLEPGATPAPTPEATASPAPTATQGPPWNGTDRLNILLVGGDSRGDPTNVGLTDTMIVASIDPTTSQVVMLSLPRDTEGVPLPPGPGAQQYGGAYPGKINALWSAAANSSAFPGDSARERGASALKGALGELYQLDIRYYVSVNFEGFRSVVRELGGVVVDVQLPVADDHYATEDDQNHINLYIPPGIQHMDESEALAYARARHQSSDFDRSQRQQRVISSLREQTDLSSLLSGGRLFRLADAFENTVHTDIPPDLFPQLVGLAQQVDLKRARSLVFTPPTYQDECASCYSLTPRVDVIRGAIQTAFAFDAALEGQRLALEDEDANVWVLKGSSVERQAAQWADYLYYLGMGADVPNAVNQGRADNLDYTETVITVYNGAEERLPTTIEVLETLFEVEVVTATDPGVPVDVIVITGSQTVKLPGTEESP